MTAVCNSSEDGVPRSTPSALTDAQTQKLFSLCQQQPDVYDAVTLILNTGMRKGELGQLRWADINFDHNHIVIAGHKSGSRRIPISSDVKTTLQARQARQQPPAEFVFGLRPSSCLFRAQRYPKPLSVELGVPAAACFRTLRHTWATRLVNAGIDMATLCYLGGWSLNSLSLDRHVNPTSVVKAYGEAYRALDGVMSHQEVHTSLNLYDPASTDTAEENKVGVGNE